MGQHAIELAHGARLLGIDLTEDQQGQLLAYLTLLNKWNKAYNLTAVIDPMEMVHRHVIDSLSIRPFLEGRRILDSGTGAGLPGAFLRAAGSSTSRSVSCSL